MTHLPFVASFPPRQAQVPPVLRGQEGGGGRRGGGEGESERISANSGEIKWDEINRNRAKSKLSETLKTSRKRSHEIKRMLVPACHQSENKRKLSKSVKTERNLGETWRNRLKTSETNRFRQFSDVFARFRLCPPVIRPLRRFRACFASVSSLFVFVFAPCLPVFVGFRTFSLDVAQHVYCRVVVVLLVAVV